MVRNIGQRWCAIYGSKGCLVGALYIEIECGMASGGSETRSSVSFTFQKKSQPHKVKLPEEEEGKKDFVLSLVGNRIER